MSEELIVYLNGKYVKQSEASISVFDQGVLFGDGVFEGIRAYNGRIFKLDEHLDRFYQGIKVLMLPVSMPVDELKKTVVETCRRNNTQDGYVRLVATRGAAPHLGLYPLPPPQPTVFCIATTLAIYPEVLYEQGMSVITATQRRNRAAGLDPQLKSLNYLNNILAKIESAQAGVPEALMLTEEGLVAEATGDNIFIVKGVRIMTPPLYLGILNGITRCAVIELARELRMDLCESPFTLHNVYTADECFLTGTAAEIISVKSVDGRIIGRGTPGPVTRKISETFHRFASANGTPVYQEA